MWDPRETCFVMSEVCSRSRNGFTVHPPFEELVWHICRIFVTRPLPDATCEGSTVFMGCRRAVSIFGANFKMKAP
jgi:hypothetical protein